MKTLIVFINMLHWEKKILMSSFYGSLIAVWVTVCLKPALWDCITSTTVISSWQIKDKKSQGKTDKDCAPVIKMQSQNRPVLSEMQCH